MPSSDLLDQLRNIVGPENTFHEPAECWPYGSDNSRRHNLPDFVVLPQEDKQVADIVRLFNIYKTPVQARGRGTGTTGACVPTHGGLVISFEKMNKILEMDPDNRLIIAQPGVTNGEIQKMAAQHGFFWPPDPTSAAFCTIGGNLAYNSAGPRAIKYGTPRENTLGLQAVTGTGEVFRTGVYTSKGVVGYDLTRLLIGSEGTLAIITEATLKLTPLPEDKRTLRAIYRTMNDAAQAVSRIMAQPVTPCALEFIDHAAIEMIRDYSQAELPTRAGALLMIEVDGLASSMPTAIAAIEQAAQNEGLLEFIAAANDKEVDALWATRKALSPALRNVAPKKINEDIVVPVSNMAKLINGLNELSRKHAIKIVNFGHAGNGNIHVNLLTNPDDPHETKRAEACLKDVFALTLSLRGTLSGEHGVGLEKRAFVAQELDTTALRLMKAIKNQFDPNNILSPGKTLPD